MGNESKGVRAFMQHCYEVGQWTSDDPINVFLEDLDFCEEKGWVNVETWRGHKVHAELTALGRSVVTWWYKRESN